MFELLSCGIVEYMTDKIKAKNIPFGFGGMAKIGGDLPAECSCRTLSFEIVQCHFIQSIP